MTLKVLVYMPKWHYGFDTRMFGVVRTIRQRGYDVDFRVATPGLIAAGDASLPCVPTERLMKDEFQAHGARAVDSTKEFYRACLSADIILAGNVLKGQSHIHEIIYRSGKPYILCDDTHDMILGTYGADLAAIPGEIDKTFLVANELMEPSRIAVTGSLHMDETRSEVNNPSWPSFCERYGLDPNKRLAVVSTSASQTQDEWVKKNQQYIVRCLQQSKQFQPILRLHPNDSAGHKRHWTYEDTSKDSAEQLYPDVPKLIPEDRIAAMNLSSVMFSILSMAAFESSIFHINCVIVDHQEKMLHAQYRGQGLFPSKIHMNYGLSEVENTPYVQKLFDEGRLRLTGIFTGKFQHRFPFRWIGSACTTEELPELIEGREILEVDEEDTRQHLSDFWYKDDGQAHVRVADLVETVQEHPEISRKLYRSRGRRLWQLGGFAVWQAARPLKKPVALTRHAARILIKGRR